MRIGIWSPERFGERRSHHLMRDPENHPPPPRSGCAAGFAESSLREIQTFAGAGSLRGRNVGPTPQPVGRDISPSPGARWIAGASYSPLPARRCWRPFPGAAPRRRPNVVLIMADDLGYGDLGVTGRTDYSTPVLDRLAREGVQLTQAYS